MKSDGPRLFLFNLFIFISLEEKGKERKERKKGKKERKKERKKEKEKEKEKWERMIKIVERKEMLPIFRGLSEHLYVCFFLVFLFLCYLDCILVNEKKEI